MVDYWVRADAVSATFARRHGERFRRETIEAELQHERSGVFIARSISEAIVFSDAYAPEHLSIQTTDPYAVADRIHHAGSIFLGGMTPVAAGYYPPGPNQLMPTTGCAPPPCRLRVNTSLRP